MRTYRVRMTVEFDTFVGANSEGEAIEVAQDEMCECYDLDYGTVLDAEASLYEEDPLAGALEAGGT